MTQISNLQAFVETVEQGSFIGASDRLQLSHSSVSARIRTLERELEVRLFHRGRHGVELNEVGRCLLPFAQTMLQAWNQAQSATRSVAAGNLPLRAGVQQDLWDVFGVSWYSRLKQELPKLQIHLTSDYSTRLCEQVDQGLLDVAVSLEPLRRRGVNLEPLAQLPLVLASNRPRRWYGRLPHDYLYVFWGQRFEDWHVEQFSSKVLSPLVVPVSAIARSMVRDNGGCAFFLQAAIQTQIDAGKFHLIEGAPQFLINVYLVSPQDQAPSALLRQVEDSIREVI